MKQTNLKIKVLSTLTLIILILSVTLMMTPTASAMSEWEQTSLHDFWNGTCENITLIDKGLESELRLSYLHVSWTERFPVNAPPSRYYNKMAPIWGTDKVLMFGGYNVSSPIYSDTWIYDYSDNNWTEKSPESSPFERFWFEMASIFGDDKVLLYGGSTIGPSGPIYPNDTWVYDLSEDNWTKKSPKSNPGGRYYHALSSIWGSKDVLFFGGFDDVTSRNDTWIYNLTDDNWTKKITQLPFSRIAYHSMASICGTDKILLFGGFSSDIQYESLIYDVSDNKWTDPKPTAKPTNRPYQYTDLVSIWGTHKAIFLGGNTFNEIWIYDFDANKWNTNYSVNVPKSRGGHAMASVWGTDKAVLFGGVSGYLLNDTWIFSLNDNMNQLNGTYESTYFDTTLPASFKTINWIADLPPNTNIKLQFRTASTKDNLKLKDFTGFDGTTSTYYTTSGESIWTSHYGDSFMQYKIYFESTNVYESPLLKNVTIVYNNLPQALLYYPNHQMAVPTNTPTFTWNFTDLDSIQQTSFQVLIDNDTSFAEVDYDSGKQSTSNQSWQFPGGTAYTELPDGTWYWKVRLKDNDGEWGFYSSLWKVIIDGIRPKSTITMPLNNGFYNNMKAVSGEAYDPSNGTGVSKVEINIERFNDNVSWTGTNWALGIHWLTCSGTTAWFYNAKSVVWHSGRQYLIQSRATDIALGVELPGSGNLFIMDFDMPVSLIESPQNNTFVNHLDNITGSAADTGNSDVDRVEISVRNIDDRHYWNGVDWLLSQNWLEAAGTTSWQCDISNELWTNGVHYTIFSRAIDNAGNFEIPGIGNTFVFDDIPPSILFYINDGDEYTISNDVELLLESFDTISGLGQMAFSTDGKNWTEWETYDATKSFSLPGDDGTQEVYCSVQDRAGNLALTMDTIILDSKPPDLKIEINDNAEFTNSTVVKVELDAVDNLSGLHRMSFGFDGNSWSSWEPYDGKKLIELREVEGEKTVYFRVKDKAGNVATATDTIILDTAAPHSLVIFIDAGAQETNSTSVVVMLEAKDDTSGVNLISFSTDGITWDPWENYTERNAYTLPEDDGIKSIYFRVVDRAGNIADPVYDTILLNTSVTQDIQPEEPPDEKEIESEFMIIVLIIIILIIIALFIVAVGYRRRRKRELELQKKKAEEEAEAAVVSKPGTGDVVIDADVKPSFPAPVEIQYLDTQLYKSKAEPTSPRLQTAQPQLPPAQTLQSKNNDK